MFIMRTSLELADVGLTPEAQLRLEGLQDKLHNLQQQDREEKEDPSATNTAGLLKNLRQALERVVICTLSCL